MAKRHKKRRGAEGVADSVAVLTFAGKPFRVASKVGLMPLMRFAKLARQGVDASDMDGLVAIYDFLRSVIADEDWEKFEEHASLVRADGDELMAIIPQAIEVISQRPTGRPSDSSAGPQSTSESSAVDSSSQVVRRLEQEGRPSIALMVEQARERDSRVSA